MKTRTVKKPSSVTAPAAGGKYEELALICRALIESSRIEEAFAEVLEIVGGMLAVENLYGFLNVADKGLLLPVGGMRGTGSRPLVFDRQLKELVFGGRKGLEFEPVDLSALGQTHPWWQFFTRNRTALEFIRSRLILPLGQGKELFGLFILAEDRETPLPDTDRLSLFKLAGRQTSLGLARLSLVRSIKDTNFATRLKALELETLQDVGVSFSSSLDLDQLTGELLLRAVSVLNVNRALVLLVNHTSGGDPLSPSMSVAESFNMEGAEKAQLQNFGGCEQILANLAVRAPTLINDPALAGRIFGCRRLIVVPIQFKEELLGAVMIADKEGRHQSDLNFSEEDLHLLTAMANQAGAAISNARLYRSVLQIKNYNENILTSIASGVITTDREGRIVSFNDSAARIFSLPASQASGMRLSGLFEAAGLADLTGRLEETLKKREAYQETNIQARSADGSKLVVNISATPLDTEEESGFSGGLVISIENISEGARVKDTLKRYVSGNIVDLVLEKGHELVLGGSLCEVTVLFADIRGFTSMSEEHTPQEVVELLNQYFDLIIDVVFRYNGTVDKIVGDEIMVLFGAPFAFPDDTLRAVGCAIEMLRTLDEFNDRRRSAGEFPLRVGVGLNRGPVISGNIGSIKHMDYTVIGDTVNTASRLVDQAHEGQILITRSVRDELSSSFESRQIESLRVKGKKDPLEVYEVTGRKD